ncbi:MAG TPA: acyltransferase family protein [Solirubrobacteraceae bacterium]|nr:acyltransferase family protein [Solirubrobacteraceae bacterium]
MDNNEPVTRLRTREAPRRTPRPVAEGAWAVPGGVEAVSGPTTARARARVSARSAGIELAHIDGLDGLRGLAVIAVILFHGGVTWAHGGFLGVELFFVLSGFLITSLLIREWLGGASIALTEFWGRRARRLLPALFVLVVVIGIRYAIKGSYDAVPGLFGDGLSALFYFSNWHQIAVGSSYFAQTGPTSPFQHTWSLAIEEQFYVLWPLLVAGAGWLVLRERHQRQGRGGAADADATSWLDTLLVLSLGLIVVSAVDSIMLFHGGAGQNRVYFGTDTRATGLLSGAALAITMARLRLGGHLDAGAWQTGGDRGARAGARPGQTRRTGAGAGVSRTPTVSLASGAVLGLTLVLMAVANGNDTWLYPWGFLLFDALAVALIATIMTTPRAIASRLFTLTSLRWVGKISYGLYLWHFPLFLWLDTGSTGLHGLPLLVLRLLVTGLISVASYVIVEQPIRQRRMPVWLMRGLAPVTAGAGVVALALAASAAAIPNPGAPVHPRAVPRNLAGTQAACAVPLANTPTSGAVAPPPADISSFQTKSLARGSVTWPVANTTKSFTTCPPKRALLIGDSIAFTIGVPYLYDEQDYGMAISDAAQLGCAFSIRGELNVNGRWETPTPECVDALRTWAAQASAFRADAVIVELGYRDEFDWRWDGGVVHLGEPTFDAYVAERIRQFISVLGDGGRRKVLFLSIPFVSPPAQADGSPAPQASTARHTRINTLIAAAVKAAGPAAGFVNLDAVISPGDHYDASLNGQLCRFDGVHVTVYCSEQLEPHILGAARSLLGAPVGR